MASTGGEVKHGFAEVNGQRIHYASAGDPAAPGIFFVHGFPEFWYAWRKQLPAFGRDHHAVAHDMRGYNLSSKPDGVEPYKTRHHVEDLRALMDHLGHDKATLVAHDWGGSVAWLFAIVHPGRVERLVIVNAPHPGVFAELLRNDPAQQRASGYMIKYRQPDAEDYCTRADFAEMRKGTLDPILARGGMTEADAREYIEAWSQPGAITGMLNFYRAMEMAPPNRKTGAPAVAPDLPKEKVAVRVPTLVIWGMADRFLLPANLERLRDYVPDLTIHRIEDGTHWVIHEYPDEVNDAIRSFIGER